MNWVLLLYCLLPGDSFVVIDLLEFHVDAGDEDGVVLAVNLEHFALTLSVAARYHFNLHKLLKIGWDLLTWSPLTIFQSLMGTC